MMLGVSHETIYNCIYAQLVGELRKDLIACLRHAHNKRVPHSKGQDRRGQIPDMLSTHLRPPDVEDCQFPGYWEGDLIKGEGNASAVGTLVERTSRLLILVKLPHPQASPCGSNKNTNGLVRQYLPKGTDLSVYSQEQLDEIADQINGRPRKGLGVRSPLAVCRELLPNSQQHSSLIH